MSFEITRQPDWPHTKNLTVPYNFRFLGPRGPYVVASFLTPPTPTGQHDLATRTVLEYLLWRLRSGNVRKKYKDDPKFGPYIYTWGMTHAEYAKNLLLSEDQVKRAFNSMTKNGIVYAVRASKSEPLHYRLTDSAFMMAHALQYLPLRGQHEANQELLQAQAEKDPNILEDHEGTPKAWVKGWWMKVPGLYNTFDMADWHKSKHATGRKLTPYEFGMIDVLEEVWIKLDNDSPETA